MNRKDNASLGPSEEILALLAANFVSACLVLASEDTQMDNHTKIAAIQMLMDQTLKNLEDGSMDKSVRWILDAASVAVENKDFPSQSAAVAEAMTKALRNIDGLRIMMPDGTMKLCSELLKKNSGSTKYGE